MTPSERGASGRDSEHTNLPQFRVRRRREWTSATRANNTGILRVSRCVVTGNSDLKYVIQCVTVYRNIHAGKFVISDETVSLKLMRMYILLAIVSLLVKGNNNIFLL